MRTEYSIYFEEYSLYTIEVIFFTSRFQVFRKLRGGSFRHYDQTVGHRASGQNNARVTVPADIVPVLQLDVREKTKAVTRKLKKKYNKFWVMAHKDIWPESVPQIFSDSDDETVASGSRSSDDSSSDSPSADDSKLNPPRERRRQGEADEKEEDEKKNNQQFPRDLLNRMVAVPATKIGLAWARDRYGLIGCRSAVMHGIIVDYDPEHRLGPVGCQFGDTDYTLRLGVAEAQGLMVPIGQEQTVMDTEPLPSDTSSDSA